MNNAAGVPRGVVVISTNAGKRGTPAWTWRKNAMAEGSRWVVLLWSERSPWLAQEDVDEARANDPIGAEFHRLFCGEWISGMGDALTEAELDMAFVPGLQESAPIAGWSYLAAFDLGISHDHSGLVVVGVDRVAGKVRVFSARGYAPSVPNERGKAEVDKSAVEADCVRLWKEYGIEWFGYDPAAGGSFLAQDLRRWGLPMAEMPFSSANLTAMAQSLVQLVKGGRLELYEDVEGRLRRDLGKFSVEFKPPNRYKLEAVSDEHGHADVGTALVICLARACEMLGEHGWFTGQERLAYDADDNLTEDELDGMDPKLREIYEMYDEGPERVD